LQTISQEDPSACSVANENQEGIFGAASRKNKGSNLARPNGDQGNFVMIDHGKNEYSRCAFDPQCGHSRGDQVKRRVMGTWFHLANSTEPASALPRLTTKAPTVDVRRNSRELQQPSRFQWGRSAHGNQSVDVVIDQKRGVSASLPLRKLFSFGPLRKL